MQLAVKGLKIKSLPPKDNRAIARRLWTLTTFYTRDPCPAFRSAFETVITEVTLRNIFPHAQACVWKFN